MDTSFNDSNENNKELLQEMIFDNKNTIGTIPPQIHEEPSHEAAVENDYSNQGMATSNIGVTNNDWFSREIEETENVTIEHDNTA